MPSMGTKPIPIMVTNTTNTTGQQNPFIAQQMQQAMQAGNGPNAGGFGGAAGLAQLGQNLYNQPYGGSATFSVQTFVYIQRDPTTNQWTTQIHAYQNGEIFVLYDGSFPITKEGLLQHFATLTTEALSEE